MIHTLTCPCQDCTEADNAKVRAENARLRARVEVLKGVLREAQYKIPETMGHRNWHTRARAALTEGAEQ